MKTNLNKYFLMFQHIYDLINNLNIQATEAQKMVEIQNLFQQTVENLFSDLNKMQNEDKKE